MCTKRVGFVLFAWVLAIPHIGSGQTLPDPRIVEFRPADLHERRAADGQPYVSRYNLEIYYPGATAPFQVVDLRKPSPDPDGFIRVTFITTPFVFPDTGVDYVARVAAVGPGGEGRSDPTAPFVFTGPCHYAFAPSEQAVPLLGGAGTVQLNTTAGCAWTIRSSQSWLTVINGAGIGPELVAFEVRQNTLGTERTATMIVPGSTFTVKQVDLPAAPTSMTVGAFFVPRKTQPAMMSRAQRLVAAFDLTWPASIVRWLTELCSRAILFLQRA